MFEKLIELLKLPIIIIFTVAVSAGILIYSSNCFLERIGLSKLINIKKDQGEFISLVFLVSLVFFINSLLSSPSKSLSNKIKTKANVLLVINRSKKYLRKLTIEEKQVLKPYLEKPTRTQSLPVGSGVVMGLERAHIIRISAQASMMDERGIVWDYNLTDWAWNYLNKHPKLLD